MEPAFAQKFDDELPEPTLVDDIIEAYATDPFFADENKTAGMYVINGLWWKGDHFVVSDSPDTKRLILQDMHDHPMAGHPGVQTLKTITSRFYWPGAGKELRNYVWHCPSCQVQLTHPAKPSGLLPPLDVPPWPFHTVTTDYITGLPLTPNGNNAIAVFVC